MAEKTQIHVKSKTVDLKAEEYASYSDFYKSVTDDIDYVFKGDVVRIYQSYDVEADIIFDMTFGSMQHFLINHHYQYLTCNVSIITGVLQLNRLSRLDLRLLLYESHLNKNFIRDSFAGQMLIQKDDCGFWTSLYQKRVKTQILAVSETQEHNV